jgi:dTDP-glucose pyrophosphorylase
MTGKAKQYTLKLDATLRDAMTKIDSNKKGIALMVDGKNRLQGTVTDGDLRRAILTGKNLDTPVKELLARKAESIYPEPISASEEDDSDKLLRLMQQHRIRQIPILDKRKRVVDLATIEDLLPDQDLPMQAVIMAGGYGKRLRPLTEDIPKPMLPVGDRPLLERTIDRLRESGIKRVQISTHYLKDKITDYFGDGEGFGVELNYVSEDQPLGTAGALGLMDLSDEPILVMNGDILTQVDFRAMLDFHYQHNADMTIAVRQYDIDVPYGVVETDGVRVVRIAEKPTVRNFINAGMYLLNPEVHQFIPDSRKYDMPELINRLIDESRMVICFPVREYWMDIGKVEDYRKAMDDLNNGVYTEFAAG